MEDKLRADQWLFVLFVFTLPFATQFNILGAQCQLSDVMFLAAAIVWIISLAAKRTSLRPHWFYVCLAAYAVAVILSTVTSVDTSRSAVKLAGKLYLIGIAFLTINCVTSIDVFRRVKQVWLIGAGVVLLFNLLGIILFYLGWQDAPQNIVVHDGYGSLPPGNYPRLEGFFAYPAILCNFLSLTWMFALASRIEWLRSTRFWLFAAALFIVDAFTLTPGFGGIFFVTGIFLQEKLRAGPKQIYGRLAFASGLLIAAAFLIITSIALFPYKSEIAPSARVHAWQTAFETFLDYPMLGRGIGQPVANASFTDPSGTDRLLTDAHNTYISLLAESGIIGFAAFMSIVGFAVLNLIRWNPNGELCKTIRLCLLLAILDAFFYQSLTGSYEDMRHLWVLFGIGVAVGRLDTSPVTNQKYS